MPLWLDIHHVLLGGQGRSRIKIHCTFFVHHPLLSAVLQRGSLFFRLIFTGAAHRDGHFVILSGEGGNTGFWRRGGIFMRRGGTSSRTDGVREGENWQQDLPWVSGKRNLWWPVLQTLCFGGISWRSKGREISGRISSRTDRAKEGESWQWQDPAIWYISGNRTLCLMVHRGNDDVLIDVFMDQTTGIVWLENTFASSFFIFMMYLCF